MIEVEVNGLRNGKNILFTVGRHNLRVFVDKVQFSIATKSVTKEKFLSSSDGRAVHRAYIKNKQENSDYFNNKNLNIQKIIRA